MLTKFIGKLLVVSFFMLTIISCGGNASVQEVVRSDPPASMTLIPIETSNSNSNEPGWERLEVETAVANSRSEFRFFVLDCEGNRGISVTSAESRQESSNWWFDSSCTIFTLPPGLIVRNPSNIAGKIPSGVTSIEFEVPYSDLQAGTFPQGAVASNSKARFNLDTDLVNPSTITFPVFEETVLNVHQSGETFELMDAKAQVSSIVQRDGNTIFADIRLQNTNALDNAEFNRIMVYGAGSDGILREAEANGGRCQPPLVGNQRTHFILNTIGPNQTTSCNVKFSNVPSNVENFHVWFSLYRDITTETKIIDGGTVHQYSSSSPSSSSTSSSSTTTSTSTSSQGNITSDESRKLVGSWASCSNFGYEFHKDNFYTFDKDGNLTIDTPTSTYTGEYSFVASNRVQYDLSPLHGGVYQVDYGNDGDYLNLTRMKGDEFSDASLCLLRIGSKLYEDQVSRQQENP